MSEFLDEFLYSIWVLFYGLIMFGGMIVIIMLGVFMLAETEYIGGTLTIIGGFLYLCFMMVLAERVT